MYSPLQLKAMLGYSPRVYCNGGKNAEKKYGYKHLVEHPDQPLEDPPESMFYELLWDPIVQPHEVLYHFLYNADFHLNKRSMHLQKTLNHILSWKETHDDVFGRLQDLPGATGVEPRDTSPKKSRRKKQKQPSVSFM